MNEYAIRRKTAPYPVVLRLDCPDKVFFTADTHFGDEKVLRLSSRPFSSVKEMDDELIKRWNETVPEDGIVFHLGDFGFGKYKYSMVHKLIRSLHGTKYLILGNHDQQCICRGHASRFESVSQQMNVNIAGQRIFLNHCPLLCFPDEAKKNVWQLFGHVHSGPNARGDDIPRLKYLLPRQYDVGVDNNDYRPVSFNQLREYFNEEDELQEIISEAGNEARREYQKARDAIEANLEQVLE